MEKIWSDDAWDDYIYWQGQDKKSEFILYSWISISHFFRHFLNINKKSRFEAVFRRENSPSEQLLKFNKFHIFRLLCGKSDSGKENILIAVKPGRLNLIYLSFDHFL